MPRPRRGVRRIRLHINLPEDLAAWLSSFAWDALTGKKRYGAESEYIISLIRRDISERREALERVREPKRFTVMRRPVLQEDEGHHHHYTTVSTREAADAFITEQCKDYWHLHDFYIVEEVEK